MRSRLPLQPQLLFSGSSYYTIEAVYGKIGSQRDVWDAIQDNSSPSVSKPCFPIPRHDLTTVCCLNSATPAC